MNESRVTEHIYMSEVKEAFDNLLEVLGPLSSEDDKMIRRAFEIANEGHTGQTRKSGEPYILHPIEVARICAQEIGLGPTAIVCALLHDVVEDTEVSLEQVRQEFGPKVESIVDGLTKLEGTYKTDIPQAENFKKVLKAMLVDVRVVLIKMADRLHNMRTLDSMPYEKQLRISGETQFIYAPLAHRLGLYNVKTEFQDICMKILDRDNYNMVAEKLQLTRSARQDYIKKFIAPLEPKIKELGIDYKIFGRPKSISSIYKKIQNKNVSFEEIYDLFAVRIVLDVPLEKEKMMCWEVYSIVTNVHTPIPERLKDWVTTPKSNGYESLHTTVIGPEGRYVEVQIRTDRMDEIAERGFAAHWKYKGIKTQQDFYGGWLDSIREILDEKDKDNIDFINDLKDQLFKDEVFTYTPNGDLKILPKGATALDFAFSIHTDVGYHCSAVKVNDKLVPLNYELHSGDQVRVITSPNQKPNERWLNSVVTSKARSKIKQSLKEEKAEIAEFGREAIQRRFKNLKLDFESNVDVLARALDYKNRNELYYDVYQNKVDLNTELKKFTIEGGLLTIPKEIEKTQPQKKIETKSARKKEPLIYLNGEPATKYKINLSKCCNPLEGDSIFGFVAAGGGVNIHRNSCPNANHMMTHYGYRIMKAEWDKGENVEFEVILTITGIDGGVGVIQDITDIISKKFGLSMSFFNIKGEHGYFEGTVGVRVHNLKEVQSIITELRNRPNVSGAFRT